MADKAPATKQIALKFLVTEDESAKIRKWINNALVSGHVAVDEPLTEGIKEMRTDVRIQLQNVECIMIMEATKTLPDQKVTCLVDDLSAGGGCISLPETIPLVKGGAFRLELKFIAPDFYIKGQIVGLRRR